MELLACPFCGTKAIITDWMSAEQKKYFGEAVGCLECEIFFDTAKEWNRRVDILQNVLDAESVCITAGKDNELGHDEDGEPIWSISISGRRDHLLEFFTHLRLRL